ncbi:MAG: hypothetical protein PHE54_04570 [Bacilli bacterium]|nr:hypothetical protein [Bacilli bacterium]
MILRKPYAFFIKQFKTIHFILTILMMYLLYRTSLMLSFFNEYVSSSSSVTGQNLTGTYFNIYVFLVPFLIAISSIIILSVMYIKKKPILFYVINIIIAIAVLVIFNYAYNVTGQMEIKILDIRIVRVVRDILLIATALELFSTVITLVRATGFNIKKFHFGEDLAGMEITAADNEEFEVDMEVDTDLVKRNFRKRLRYAKYVYVENHFLINIAFLLLMSTTFFIIYLNTGVYNKTYDINTAFVTKQFLMRVNDVYITNEDYSGNVISDDKTLVIVDLGLKNRSSTNRTLSIVKTVLVIAGHKFYPTIKYRDYLTDIGVSYQSEDITNDSFQSYILTYEIPKEYADKKMEYLYIDDSNYFSTSLEVKTVTVALTPRDLDEVTFVDHYNLEETVTFKDSIFKKTDFKITNFDIQKQFKITYDYCISSNCYSSIEYLKPSIYTNYNKVLIKLNATLSWDEDLTISKNTDIYNFINKYGKIKYQIGNTVKYNNVSFKEVKSSRVKNNNYYIEVIDEVMDADSISLVITIRDKQYEYILK